MAVEVEADLLAKASAEELPHRQAESLALDVPERGLEAADRVPDDATEGARSGRGPAHLLDQALHVEGVLAHEQGCYLLEHRGQAGSEEALPGAVEPGRVVGVDAHVRPVEVGLHHRGREAGDLHRASGPPARLRRGEPGCRLDLPPYPLAVFLVERRLPQSVQKRRAVDQAVADRGPDVGSILLPTGDVFRDHQVVCNGRGRTNDMLELRSCHGCRRPPRTRRQMLQRVRGSRAPAKGEVWRRSRARSPGSVRKVATSAAGRASTALQASATGRATLPAASHPWTRARARESTVGSATRRSATARWSSRLVSSTSACRPSVTRAV